ncbi:MAG TPA: ABC transporter ATP-binding protein [Chloroflexota bacterium]|nr:ABC transporter ATP-binding protein [Chloroflexota bacterium]
MSVALNRSLAGDLAIEMIHLRKEFGRKVAVEDLSLRVPRGEIFGFLGPNGAGKTTSIKVLMGLVSATSGEARLLGLPPQDLRAKARIGFLPELFRFHEWLTAEQFLDFHGQLYGMPPEKRRKRIPEVLELVGLRVETKNLLRNFSKGMQQRIGLAQAILNDPDVVLLDEPTSALDPLGRRDVRDLMRYLKDEGRTVFLNSHLLSEVELVCDRVAIIDRGRVIATGALQDLLAASMEIEVDAEGVTPEALEELRSNSLSAEMEGGRLIVRLRERESIPQIAETILRHGGRLYSLSQRRGSLEELFIRVVEQEEAR